MAIIAPGQFDALLARLRKLGHTPRSRKPDDYALPPFRRLFIQYQLRQAQAHDAPVGASTQLRKDECIAVIRQGLADPAKVKAALATLTPLEANALALLKAAGGAMDARAGHSVKNDRQSAAGTSVDPMPMKPQTCSNRSCGEGCC